MGPTYMVTNPIYAGDLGYDDGLGGRVPSEVRMRCDRCGRVSPGEATLDILDARCANAGWCVQGPLCPDCSGFRVQAARVLGMLVAAATERLCALEES